MSAHMTRAERAAAADRIFCLLAQAIQESYSARDRAVLMEPGQRRQWAKQIERSALRATAEIAAAERAINPNTRESRPDMTQAEAADLANRAARLLALVKQASAAVEALEKDKIERVKIDDCLTHPRAAARTLGAAIARQEVTIDD